jgi:hypothetical protein
MFRLRLATVRDDTASSVRLQDGLALLPKIAMRYPDFPEQHTLELNRAGMPAFPRLPAFLANAQTLGEELLSLLNVAF